MLKITKVVSSSVAALQGCGKFYDSDCGRNARMG